MMKRRFRGSALAAAVILGLVVGAFVGCGAASGPEAAALDFMDALGEMDIKRAREHVTEEGKPLLGFLEAMAGEMSDAEKEEMKATKFTVVSSEITGDTATVVLDSNGQETPLNLKKVEGDWKVDLNKEDLEKEM